MARNTFSISRRDLLIALGAALAGGVSSRYWHPLAGDNAVLNIALPLNPDLANPSYEVFYALSRLVTLREKLHPLSAQKMYPLFMDEPWGAQHIGSSYAQILSLAGLPPYTTPPLSPAVNGRLGQGQAWFVSHLLTTWYLGVYYHEQRPTTRITYEHALMFDAIRGRLPIPQIESAGFGTWTKPPTT